MKINIRVVISVACLAIALSCGCQMREPDAPGAPKTVPAFSASLPPAIAGKTIKSGGSGNAEELNFKKIDKIADVKSEDGFMLLGWALSESTKSVPETVFIELAPVKGGKNYYTAASRYDREDVAKYFKESSYKKAGYTVKADIKSVPSGEYEINVIQIDNENPIRVSPGKKLNKTN